MSLIIFNSKIVAEALARAFVEKCSSDISFGIANYGINQYIIKIYDKQGKHIANYSKFSHIIFRLHDLKDQSNL